MVRHEIFAYCSSEKTDVSIGFGTSFVSENDHFDYPSPDWITEGIEDSFWENYEEFEIGIQQAYQLRCEEKTLNTRQALFTIFGHFNISYKVDGLEADINYNYNIDVDEIIYSMLERQ